MSFLNIQDLSPLRAVLLAALILGAFLTASYILRLPDKATAHISALLRESGFERAEIDTVELHGNGLTAHNIKLDPYGFDTIERMRVDFSWPAFLLSGKIFGAQVEGMSLTREPQGLRPLLHRIAPALLTPQGVALRITDAQLNVNTPAGALRFTLDATFGSLDEQNRQPVSARLRAAQYQLSFDSQWDGHIGEDGTIELGADIKEGRLHLGALSISRFGGWAAFEASPHELSLQTQLEAGAASLFGAPLQAPSLVADLKRDTRTALFRSTISGLPETALSIDLSMYDNEHRFDMRLAGSDIGGFFRRVSEESGRSQDKALPNLFARKAPFEAAISYEPDLRFAGGPWPFSLRAAIDAQQVLSGNFLVYPDKLDSRGSAEATPDMARAMERYFKIPADKIEGNFIRLDGDLGNYLFPDGVAQSTLSVQPAESSPRPEEAREDKAETNTAP